MNVASRVDLEQFGSVDMTDFDERSRDEQKIRRMEGNAVWSAFPFNSLTVPVWLAVTIDI